MARYCDLVGHEIAKELLRDSLVREMFVPALQPIFSVLMQTAVSLNSGDPEDDTSAYSALERLFAPPGTAVASFEPTDFYTLPFDEDHSAFNENQAQLAQWIARLLGPVARSAMSTGARDRASHTDTPQPRNPVPDNFEAAADVLSANDDTATVADDLRDEGVFSAATTAAGAATAMGAVIAPTAFVDFLRSLANYLARLCPRLAWLPGAIVTEVATTTMRAGIAESMAQAAARIPLHINSSLRIGSYVHRRLQERYEDRRSMVADVVSERWNPIINRPDQTVIGLTTGGSPLPLSDVARSAVMDPDWFFRCLRMALASPRLDRETWLRADLIDRQLLSIWEIKPVASAQSGVWQEAIYRNSFNLVRALLECMRIAPLTGPLSPGGSMIVPGTGRTGVASSTASLFNPIDISSQAGMPAVAIPFQVVVLPGLLPYVCFRSPNQGEIVMVLSALIAAAMREAARLAREAGRRLATAAARALEEALQGIRDWATPENIALAVLAIIVIILIVIAVVASGGLAGLGAGGAAAGTGTAGAAGAAGTAGAVGAGAAEVGLGAAIAEAFAGFIAFMRGIGPALRLAPAAASGMFIIITPATPGTGGSTDPFGEPQTTLINVHGLSIDGMPTGAIGPLLQGLGGGLVIALGDVATRLRRSRRAGGGGTVA